MKTSKEIALEVQALIEIKPHVRKQSAFGDNHHDAIDAQIAVLRDDSDDEDIEAVFGEDSDDEYAENVYTEALYARAWVRGDEAEAPSATWEQLRVTDK